MDAVHDKDAGGRKWYLNCRSLLAQIQMDVNWATATFEVEKLAIGFEASEEFNSGKAF